MKKRDIELLSAYLDGELKPSDSTKLEVRLKSDPELASVLSDLRATRTILRKLPSRRAPRNFTLTRRMVGQNPPLPRAYPIFRFATVLATLLFVFTFGLNFMGAQIAAQPPAYGIGGGGGGDTETYAAATEAPAEAPALAQPAPTEEAGTQPSIALAPTQPTVVPSSEDSLRTAETPVLKNAGEPQNPALQNQIEIQKERPLVSSQWQIVLAAIAVVGGILMLLMHQLSARRWKQ